jgi:hypothetical protein
VDFRGVLPSVGEEPPSSFAETLRSYDINRNCQKKQVEAGFSITCRPDSGFPGPVDSIGATHAKAERSRHAPNACARRGPGFIGIYLTNLLLWPC